MSSVAKGYANLTAVIDKNSAIEVRRLLERFPLTAQDAILRKAMRNYNRSVAKQVKAARPKRTGALAKAVSVKVKNYKGVIWGCVAARTGLPKDKNPPKGGRALRKFYDRNAGWREHFQELGFHSWSPSWPKPGKGSGKGWKLGKYHRGRGRHHAGDFRMMSIAIANSPRLRQYLDAALVEAVKQYTQRAPMPKRIIWERV